MAEITFLNPIYLWFLISIPLLVITHFFLLKHAKTKGLKFANFETIKRVTGKKTLTKNLSVLTIRVLIILFVVMAASGANLWFEGDSNRNNFVIALDVSASMTTEDLQPSRLEAAKENAIKFVDLIKSDSKIGLVTSSGVTFINEIPTSNRLEIKQAIKDIDIARAGGTDIPGAIITSANLLADSDKGKTMILISDGSNTIGTFIEDSIGESIAYAQDAHMIIHTIGTGKENEEPIGYIPEYYNISSIYSEENLQKISNLTGGKYYSAVDNQKLLAAYKEISEDADKAILHIDLTIGLIFIALCLLFIEWGLSNTRFRRIP